MLVSDSALHSLPKGPVFIVLVIWQTVKNIYISSDNSVDVQGMPGAVSQIFLICDGLPAVAALSCPLFPPLGC
jgi:hypothetical protein